MAVAVVAVMVVVTAMATDAEMGIARGGAPHRASKARRATTKVCSATKAGKATKGWRANRARKATKVC